MKTAICALIKNEHRFLKEWIDWHLNLGFDAIHLFEDKGSESHEEIVKEYDNVFLRRYEADEELRQIIAPEYNNNKQLRLYQWFCDNCNANWVAFIDIDEFFMFEEGWCLDKLCAEFSSAPAVFLFWKMKGASGHIKRPSCGVVEAYTEDSPFLSQDKGWNMKSLVNIDKGLGMRTVHHANGVVCTDNTEGYEPVYAKAWLNHYFTKSWEDWCDRIYKRGAVYNGHRTLAQFFEVNPSMTHLRERLITSVDDIIPNGTHWLDKKRRLIAGGNVKKIQSLNIPTNELDYRKVTPYYKVSDTYCIAVVPKCGCSTVALQTLYYHNRITMGECEMNMYRHIKNKHHEADALNKNLDFNSINLKKVQIIRNPVERFVSAYHTGQYSNTPWKIFLYEKATQMMQNDRHFTPQYLYTKSPDIYIHIKDYEKFCIENNIMFTPANVNNKQQYLNFTLDEKDKKYIEYLYKEDYDFIKSIIKSNKLWTPSDK